MAVVKELLMTSLVLSFNFYAKEKVRFSKVQTGYEERMRYWEWQMAFLIRNAGLCGLIEDKAKAWKARLSQIASIV